MKISNEARLRCILEKRCEMRGGKSKKWQGFIGGDLS
jgi:hypothetical protein